MVKNENTIKTKVLLPQALVTLANFGDPYLGPLVYLLAKRFKLFGFPIFRFRAYLMKVILSVPDEIYSRNALCALNLISTFY